MKSLKKDECDKYHEEVDSKAVIKGIEDRNKSALRRLIDKLRRNK